MSVNKSTIDWLESQEHPVAICVAFTKETADNHRASEGLPPLTDDQWYEAVGRLEKRWISDADREEFYDFIDRSVEED